MPPPGAPPPRKRPTGGAVAGATARAARAELLQRSNSKREEEAAFIFHKFDRGRSGYLDEEGLLACFAELGFANGRQNKTDDEMRQWVRREIKKGDVEGNGKLSVSVLGQLRPRAALRHGLAYISSPSLRC